MVDVCKHVQLVIRTLQGVRSEVEGFHGDCFTQACDLARKLDVVIKKPQKMCDTSSVSLLKVPLRIYLCVVKLETRYNAHRKATLFTLVGGCFASLPFFVAADSKVLL